MLASLMGDTMTIHKSDGQTLEAVRGRISQNQIVVMDGSLVIEAGDVAERLASNGLREFYEVIAPGFSERFGGIDAHYQMKVRSISKTEFLGKQGKAVAPSPPAKVEGPGATKSIRIFISHSSSDVEVAANLIALLRSALNLPASDIRCTSVDGHRLKGGANTMEAIRAEVRDSEVFVALISRDSLASAYVMFELGARWGADRPLIPLLVPGATADILEPPLSNINALHLESDSQGHQVVREIGDKLNLPCESPAVYATQLAALRATPQARSVGDKSTAADVRLRGLSPEAEQLLLGIREMYQHGGYPPHGSWPLGAKPGQEVAFRELRAQGIVRNMGTGETQWLLTDKGLAIVVTNFA